MCGLRDRAVDGAVQADGHVGRIRDAGLDRAARADDLQVVGDDPVEHRRAGRGRGFRRRLGWLLPLAGSQLIDSLFEVDRSGQPQRLHARIARGQRQREREILQADPADGVPRGQARPAHEQVDPGDGQRRAVGRELDPARPVRAGNHDPAAARQARGQRARRPARGRRPRLPIGPSIASGPSRRIAPTGDPGQSIASAWKRAWPCS